jgi:excisionase family DNA binding protein
VTDTPPIRLDVVALAGAIACDPEAVMILGQALTSTVATHSARSPYMTAPEAAQYLRCKRQRIDDLLSAGRLTRYKEGRRTLVARAEVEALALLKWPARPVTPV